MLRRNLLVEIDAGIKGAGERRSSTTHVGLARRLADALGDGVGPLGDDDQHWPADEAPRDLRREPARVLVVTKNAVPATARGDAISIPE